MAWWSVGVVDWLEGEGLRMNRKKEGFYRREENYLTEFEQFGSMWILNVKMTT